MIHIQQQPARDMGLSQAQYCTYSTLPALGTHTARVGETYHDKDRGLHATPCPGRYATSHPVLSPLVLGRYVPAGTWRSLFFSFSFSLLAFFFFPIFFLYLRKGEGGIVNLDKLSPPLHREYRSVQDTTYRAII